jgi:LytR cell envelope-related transcriptional attenuator
MMRRPAAALVAVIVVAAIAVGAIILTRPREQAQPPARPAAVGEDLVLLVVRSATGPFAAVVGSTGGRPGALIIPTEISVTVPGQGDARLDEALDLPPNDATTTVANVLGIGISHYAILGRLRLAAVVDRAGGLEVAGSLESGDEVVSTLEGARRGRTVAFQLALEGLLSSGVSWEAGDLDETDDAPAALAILHDAEGADVTGLRAIEPQENIFRVEPEAVHDGVMKAFGGPDRPITGVIVLNGSGVPGVGEAVADRVVPAGFSVVVSENASSFDHDQTLIVVGSSSDVALGQRVRDLLGVGTVSVSVSSGLAPVTIVVGKDFDTG